MKTFKILLTALLASVASATLSFAEAAIGAAAPDFTLTDINGTSHTLSSFKGKTVVLEWTNPGCPFVVRHYDKTGNIPALQHEVTKDGVIWLAINSAAAGKQGDLDEATAKAWLEKNKAAPTAYFRDKDGKVGHAYNARTTPHLFVINAAGVLVYDGAIDSNAKNHEGAENYVRTALADLKQSQTVKKQKTQPYGCSVKY